MPSFSLLAQSTQSTLWAQLKTDASLYAGPHDSYQYGMPLQVGLPVLVEAHSESREWFLVTVPDADMRGWIRTRHLDWIAPLPLVNATSASSFNWNASTPSNNRLKKKKPPHIVR